MDKQTLIASLADSKEDQMLLARVWDRLSAGARRNIPAATCFLTGREQLLAQRLCRQGGLEEPIFFGGYDRAERRVAAYVPDYYEAPDFLYGDEGPVAALHVTYSDYDTLNHRDFLGSLMGQGIKREILGDLLPGARHCDILVLRDMSEYLATQLTQVGRASVQTRQITLSELEVPEQKVRNITDTVASLRLDNILAAGFQQGRSKAAALICAGRVEVNHMPALKPDHLTAEGDILSVRGLGKLKIAEIRGQTKKGRISVLLQRYL